MFVYLFLILLFVAIFSAGFFGTAYEIAGRYVALVRVAREKGRLDIIREIRSKIGRRNMMAKTVTYFMEKKLGPNWDR
jgi:hypothetical protein